MNSNACPWDNRRESSEVTYSFLTTCFAAFTAYGHLEHSLLGNHNSVDIACKILLFFICPSSPLIDLVFLRLLPALAMFVGLKKPERIEYHSSRSESCITSTTRNFQFLLAQILGMYATKADHERVSVSLVSSSHRRFVVEPREDSRSIRNGQALTLGFLTMQCLGAVIKGSRRLARGSGMSRGDPQHKPAVVLADAEILWFALSGVSILFFSWISLYQNKQWKLHESEDTDDRGHIITINTVALVLLCSLFSTLAYLDFYHNEPFWNVGFFHFLYVSVLMDHRNAVLILILMTQISGALLVWECFWRDLMGHSTPNFGDSGNALHSFPLDSDTRLSNSTSSHKSYLDCNLLDPWFPVHRNVCVESCLRGALGAETALEQEL